MSHEHLIGKSKAAYRKEAEEEALETPAIYGKKTAMAKSMARHQSKLGKKAKGQYPGYLSDKMDLMRRQMANTVKRFNKK
jgi:hypothetical protein